MNNLLSYCGLVDARISAPEKDLPVPLRGKHSTFETTGFLNAQQSAETSNSSSLLFSCQKRLPSL